VGFEALVFLRGADRGVAEASCAVDRDGLKTRNDNKAVHIVRFKGDSLSQNWAYGATQASCQHTREAACFHIPLKDEYEPLNGRKLPLRAQTWK